MKKRLISVLLVLVMVLGMLPTVAMAADTPIEISTAEKFAEMESGKSYILTKDITIKEPYSKGSGFSGSFDGGRHTITLEISQSSANGSLFKTLEGASGSTTTVKNVIIQGSVDIGNKNYVGGIAGTANVYGGPILIENCKNIAMYSSSSIRCRSARSLQSLAQMARIRTPARRRR